MNLESITVSQVFIWLGAFYGAIKLIDGLQDMYKKHSIKDAMHKELENAKTEINKQLVDYKEKIEFHTELLDKDKKHFEKVDADIDQMKNDVITMQKQSDKQFQIMVKTMLALVSYSLDNSNKDDLKKAQQELLNYLAEN